MLAFFGYLDLHVHTVQKSSSLTPLISFLLIENNTLQGFAMHMRVRLSDL